MKATVTGFASDAVRLIRTRLPVAAWAVVMIVATGSVLTGLKPAADTSTNVAFALLAVGFYIFTFWTSAVVTRFMAARPGPRWAVDGAFLKFLGAQLLVMIFVAVVAYAFDRMLPAASHSTSFAAGFALVIVVSLAILPLGPWFTALAIGDRTLGPGGALTAMRGAILALAGAALLLILPIQLLHSAVASSAVRTAYMPLRTALGVADGLISAFALVVLPWALFTAAWRFIRGEAVHETPPDDIA